MDRRYHNLRRRLDQQGYKHRFDVESIDLVEKLYIDLVQAKNYKYGQTSSSSLAKENAELQKEIAKIKSGHESQLKALQNEIAKLENEVADYKLLNNQYEQRIKQLEDEVKKQSRPNQASANQLEVNSEASRKFKLDQQNSDVLKMNDDKFARLQLEKDSLKMQLDHANQLLLNLREQVGLKGDKLSKNLHNDHAANPCSDHLVAHLTFEMEHLQRLNYELEKKLKDVINSEKESQWNEHRQLIDHNKQLENNLVGVDQIAEAFRKQKDELVATADKEMNEAKEEIKKLYNKTEQQEKDFSNLKKENEQLIKEKSDTQASLAIVNTQIKSYESLIKSLQEEKKQQSLNSTDKQEEIRSNFRVVNTSNLETVIKSIEKQRDFYKIQLENFSNRNQQHKKSVNIYEENIQIQWNPLISFIEEERDAYKQECNSLRKFRISDKENVQPQGHIQVAELQAKIHNITEENRELNKTLETLEKHIDEVNISAEGLAAEKAALQKLYDKVLAAHEQQKEKAGQNVGATLRDAIARVQLERDKALANSQRAEMEIDILRNKLRLSTEAQALERKRLDDKIADLELRQLKGSQSAEFLAKITATEVELFSANEENSSLKRRISQLEAETAENRAKVDKLTRDLADKSEKAVRDTERILTQKASEKSLVDDKVKSLEREIDELRDEIDRRDSEIRQLKISITMLDRDKDKFQVDMDEKTEQVLSLTDSLNTKIKEEMDLKLKVANLEKRIDRMADEVMQRDGEISILKRDLDLKKRESEEVKKRCDELSLKCRRLDEDMQVLIKDNLALQKDLKNSQAEKELLKREVQDYVNEVGRVERLMQGKEEERNELLEQFRNLSAATSNLEYQNNSLEVQANNSKMEVLAKQAEINHSKELIDSLSQEIQEFSSKQQNYEVELRTSQINLNDVQIKLNDKSQENDRFQREITALRDLNVRLSSDKDNVAKDLRNKEKERVLVEASLSEAKRELESSKIQLNAEVVAVKSLEQLLANNRQKDYQTQLSNRELTDELAILKEKLRQTESKLNELSNDVSKHRSRSVELQLEIDRLKRQLVDAQFESTDIFREKLNQDMIRLRQLSPTYVVTTTVTETRTTNDNPLHSKANKDKQSNSR